MFNGKSKENKVVQWNKYENKRLFNEQSIKCQIFIWKIKIQDVQSKFKDKSRFSLNKRRIIKFGKKQVENTWFSITKQWNVIFAQKNALRNTRSPMEIQRII